MFCSLKKCCGRQVTANLCFFAFKEGVFIHGFKVALEIQYHHWPFNFEKNAFCLIARTSFNRSAAAIGQG